MARPRPAAAAGTAAAAAAVAAAAGGRLVRDRRAARARERAYRLHADEAVPDGIRRIAAGQLAAAHEQLAGASGRALDEAVHDARKRLKRLRACLRIARDALGAQTYRRENAAYRTAGRRLSGTRDARVLLATLDALAERSPELTPAITGLLRARLNDEHERATDALQADDGALAATLAELEEARARTASWTLDGDGFAVLEPGLRRIYSRGRRRMRAAAREPTAENLHEARKRVKDLWHAAQIVRPARPKKLKQLARRAHELADLLGDEHDLAVLRDYAERHPQCFADDASRLALVAAVERRRTALQRTALKRGRQLYARSPKRFVEPIERGWHKRLGAGPQPLVD